MNGRLQALCDHLEEAIKHAGRITTALPAVGGSGGHGNDGPQEPWTGEMPPWALGPGNSANPTNLTNGFPQPPTGGSGGG